MKNRILLCIACLLTACASPHESSRDNWHFTVFVDHPESRSVHVDFQCDGLKPGSQEFRLPAWMPGYYRIMGYAKNVSHFAAKDAAGNPLKWEKTGTNIWSVDTGAATAVTISYDIATAQPIFEDSIAEDRGFIAPPDTFMYLPGRINHPVTVTIKPKEGWTKVANGLDPVPGMTNTFYAPDFDILYDCPMLMGKLETIKFDVKGVPHEFVGVNIGEFDHKKFTNEMQRMVDSATTIMRDVPYKHYTFIVSGRGGGVEHLDSTTLPFTASQTTTEAGDKRWLQFVAHEYFHNFNVKRIRPIVLGPFDYDKENYTHMLWVSEGFTDYYAWMSLRRANLITTNDLLGNMTKAIDNYENIPGHLYQSAAQASMDTWAIPAFGRVSNGPRMTISYYDKGSILGALIDLKIRHETKNAKSLDDVMRGLYKEYYKDKKRGFTDEEFQQMCERMAGTELGEVFTYANTTTNIDYAKYFGYAGLEVSMPAADLGVTVRDADGKLLVSAIAPTSLASKSGIAVDDEITSVDGANVTASGLAKIIASKTPWTSIEIGYTHNGKAQTAKIILGDVAKDAFRLTPKPNPTELELAIYKDWLRGA